MPCIYYRIQKFLITIKVFYKLATVHTNSTLTKNTLIEYFHWDPQAANCSTHCIIILERISDVCAELKGLSMGGTCTNKVRLESTSKDFK